MSKESIKNHKWISDSNMGEANISILECDDNSITLSVGHPDECFNSSLYRSDAIAIAKHFNLIHEKQKPIGGVIQREGFFDVNDPCGVKS